MAVVKIYIRSGRNILELGKGGLEFFATIVLASSNQRIGQTKS
jgi:hypothetical protein